MLDQNVERAWNSTFNLNNRFLRERGMASTPKMEYRGSPLSTNSLSMIPGIVRIQNRTNSMNSPVWYNFFCKI